MEMNIISNYGRFWPSNILDLTQVFFDYLPGRNFVDLGSGDGRVVKLACRFAKKANGYEIDPKLYDDSKVKDLIYN